jgi:hypothetical protein
MSSVVNKEGFSLNNTEPLLDNQHGSPDRSSRFGPDEDFTENRSIVERTFGEMGEGSIRGSIFTICSIAIGAGALSVPYVIATLGWALGGSMVIVASFTSIWSLRTIVSCANIMQVLDYSKLCEAVLGKAGLRVS